ncbi:MAG: hypothetical protein DI547_17150 [Sphingobium sp.]|nr:MAG: hypothetical protein DI547_17150 [Sphingobium sp.]
MATFDSGDLTPPHVHLVPLSPPRPRLTPELIRAAELLAPAPEDVRKLPPIPTVLGGPDLSTARVRGRGLTAPEVMCDTQYEAVTLRFEDANNPAFWLEVELTTAHVAELLARTLRMRAMSEAAELDMLKRIAQFPPR